MDYKDYYKILGVDKKADAETVKRAYRQLAKQYHPDLNPGDRVAEERFKEVNEAYEVLKDPDKRQKYDLLGNSWQQYQAHGGNPGGFDWARWANAGGGAPGAGGGFSSGGFSINLDEIFGAGSGKRGTFGGSDFFNAIFGNMAANAGQAYQQAYQVRGEDIDKDIQLTLEEVATGAARTLRKGDRSVTVKVPAGAQTGTKIRLAGEGRAGINAESGDLYLKVHVMPHPTFERMGDDLQLKLTIPLYTAILGGKATVPLLGGGVGELNIPAETQSGSRFKLAGKGLPNRKHPTQFGDLYALIQVQIPTQLNEQERKLFRQLAALRPTA
jgi:curved DNA-binding protein